MTRIRLTFLFLVALCACGDEDRTQTRFTPAADKASTSTDDTAPPLTRVTPERADTVTVAPSGPSRLDLPLAPVAGAPARGGATLGRLGDHTTVAVTLQGGRPGAHYEGQVRRGTCARIGDGVASLNPVSADSSGAGASDSDVAVPSADLSASPHVVVLGLDGRPELCGAIPGDSA